LTDFAIKQPEVIVQFEEERFYVIVPEVAMAGVLYPMEPGRLMAQTFHLGRVVEHRRALAGADREDVTTIVLAARNTKELEKILSELVLKQLDNELKELPPFAVSAYRDHNPPVYMTPDKTLTAVCVGPVKKSIVDSILGHMELF
jgi:hypothetical protein